MKIKNIIITLIFFISINVSMLSYAEVNATANLFQINKYQPKNTNITFHSLHAFNITNRTYRNQNITVCYKLISCENANPAWLRISQQCTSYNVSVNSRIQDSKQLSLTVNYPFNGSTCTLESVTQITGDQQGIANDKNSFIIR